MHNRTTLPNGIDIVSRAMPMQSVAVGVWIKIGGRYETKKLKGISHYLEHLLFKGSRSFSGKQIKENIEGLGGALNGFTSEEFTCYFAKIPYKHRSKAFTILSDMVINPLLRERDIERERTVILEELKMYKDLPNHYVNEILDGLLWPKQSLGESIIGTVESVNGITRHDLVSFQKRYYSSPNIVVSAAGKLDHDSLVQDVHKIFSKLTEKEKNSYEKAVQAQQKPQMSITDKKTEQTHLALGFHSVPREHPLKYALALLHVVLGGNMSSRLFEEVREKRGLAYQIGTQVKHYNDTGAFVVHAGIDNRKVEETLVIILKELNKTRKSLVTKDELKRAKEFYTGQLMLALEETLDHMLWIGESLASRGKIHSLNEIIKAVSLVTLDDIRKAARMVFTEQSLNCALIGPLKNSHTRLSKTLTLS